MRKFLSFKNLKISIIVFWVILAGLFYANQVTKSKKLSADEYNAWISKTYDYRFGKDSPFSPSNATTYNGQFISGEDFIPSERCAKCHTDIHPQWKDSAHANSFREPFYQKNVKDLINQRNIAFTRHCEACHNPAALFSGALTDKPQFKKRPFDEEGVSCISCHSIESVNRRGVGGYTMGQPALLQKSDGTKILEATDQEILDNVPDHKRAMMRPLLKQPEFCGACHKSQVPQELNNYKFLRAFAVADELQQSSFSKESPHPFYVRDKADCNSCHMPNQPAKFFDVSANSDGVVASHRWSAANTAIPAFYGFKEQLSEVEKFLADDKLGVDIFALWRREKDASKDEFIAPVNRSNFKIADGDVLTAEVVVTNKNIGHSFPPELRDFYEAYIEFTVENDQGQALYKSGYIKPDGYLDEYAHNYKTYLVKPDGSANEFHYIWQTRVIPQNLAIPSGRSDVARYRFTVPENLSGALKLSAKLKYRRFTRVFSDYSLGKSTDFPIVTMASTEKILNIGENVPDKPAPNAMPDWRRWNNYGISLLDQRQFAAAADAFAKVITLDEKYRAFALTNRALALMQIDRWDEARELIEKAIALDPKNFRAIFQRGRINRIEGKLAEAEADFLSVNAAYPTDRLTLQQLGELAKIKRDFQSARKYFEAILQIDPEDTGAHYNMMLVYNKLNMKDEAKREAKIFEDLKEDPRTTALASEFLQKNPAVGRRSLPYYVNEMPLFQNKWEKSNYFFALK
jgi:tetratricopeptide (TPR) repeat protein